MIVRDPLHKMDTKTTPLTKQYTDERKITKNRYTQENIRCIPKDKINVENQFIYKKQYENCNRPKSRRILVKLENINSHSATNKQHQR